MDKIEIGNKLVAIKHDEKIIIDNSVFSKLSIEERGEATTAFIKVGGEVDMRADFNNFTDYKELVRKFKVGEDISTELMFNSIELPVGYKEALDTYNSIVAPVIAVLEKLEPPKPPYPFADKPTNSEKDYFMVVSPDKKRIKRNGHSLSDKTAEMIWKRASPYWAGIKQFTPDSHYPNNISSYVSYYTHKIEIGCQTVPRWEVEQLALEMGWEFPSRKAK